MIGGYQSLVLMEHAAIRSVSRADILNKNTLVQCLSKTVARRLDNISDTLCCMTMHLGGMNCNPDQAKSRVSKV
jgi:hypothetical protein